MEIICVPGHQGIKGNGKAVECVVKRSSLDETVATNDVQTPLIVATNKIPVGLLKNNSQMVYNRRL